LIIALVLTHAGDVLDDWYQVVESVDAIWNITPTLNVTAGVRYSHRRRTAASRRLM